MKNLIYTLTLVTSPIALAQTVAQDILPPTTEFYLGAQFDDRFLRGYNLSINGGGNVQLSQRWAFLFNAANAPSPAMDNSRKSMVEEYLQSNNYKATPTFVHTKGSVSFNLRKSLVSSVKKGETIYRSRFTSLYAGYQFQQQTYFSSQGIDYYQTTLTPDGEAVYVTGYQVHNVSLGLRIASTRQRGTSTHRWIATAGVLHAVYQKNCQTVSKNDGTAEIYRWKRDDYDILDLGFEAGLQWYYYPKGHWGMTSAIEYAYTPLPFYKYNDSFFVPRGGAGIRNTAFTFRLGVAYRLEKR